MGIQDEEISKTEQKEQDEYYYEEEDNQKDIVDSQHITSTMPQDMTSSQPQQRQPSGK